MEVPRRLALLTCTFFLLSMARSEDHFYDFFLVEKTYWRICNHTIILTVNGSFPGPTLRVRKGDTAFVNVHNHGTYGVTIHWHGVKQPRNPWSDGPDFITQCQISPGTNHTYKVIFSTEEGTLWWHAHSDWTQSTVYGAIHILPAEGTTYPFPEPDGEHDIILGSWYNYDVNKKLHYDLYVGADLPSPNAFLINGQLGAYFNCSAEEMHRIIVDYGKTYLLRIINAALNSEFFFAIAGHNLTVVGMDGSYLKPFITKYLVISPGQTMNVLLATNQNPSHYYIAGRQFVSAGNIENEEPTAAVLEYIGKYTPPSSPVFPSSLPVFRDIRAANAFWARLRSLASKEHSVSVPKHVDHPMFIVVSEKIIACPNRSCDSDNGNRISSSMNNITFQNPIANILLAYYRNISGVYTPDFPDFPEVFYDFTDPNLSNNYTVPSIATKVKMINFNETVEIVFQGTDTVGGAQDHPVHMHGYSFYVVGFGLGDFNNETDPKSYNLVDPPELNTIRVPKNGWVTVRFTANNPGVWMLHCHLTKHLTWGMKTVLIVLNGDTPETSILDPPPSMPSCNFSFVNYIQKFKHSDVVHPVEIIGM